MDTEEIIALAGLLRNISRVAILTGAGISAESGVPTFRGKDGLWNQFRAEDLATPEAFERDPALVWQWYNWRRGLIAKVEPNPAHKVLAQWERAFPSFVLITQNVDGLHKKAGSTNILELHGNIWKVRCTKESTVEENYLFPLPEIPPRCPACKALLRPHVIWFGESLDPAILNKAFAFSTSCEVMFAIGTSAFIQPAASFPIAAAEAGAKIVEINPDPTPLTYYADFSFREKAGEILPLINDYLNKK